MSKYHNRQMWLDGMRFDSAREAQRWCELRLLERAGQIKGLRRQVPFVLIPKSVHGKAIKYIADFVYMEDGREKNLIRGRSDETKETKKAMDYHENQGDSIYLQARKNILDLPRKRGKSQCAMAGR